MLTNFHARARDRIVDHVHNHAHNLYSVGPGFEPLALHHDRFGRSRVGAADLAA